MNVTKASIISLCYGRYDLTKQVYNANLSNCGMPYELLICDQGLGASDDERIANMRPRNEFIEYLKSLSPSHLRLNEYNEGVARSLNQLMIRCSTDYIFFMPPDILLPDNWLRTLVDCASDIAFSGVVGFEEQDLILPEYKTVGSSGKNYTLACRRDGALDACQVYGATLVTRKLIDTIGYYCESYHPYGLEDTDYCFRAQLAGFLCYYIHGYLYNTSR